MPSWEVADVRGDLDPEALLALAEDAVRSMMGMGADCGEAYVSSGRSVSVDVEKDVVTYTMGDADAGIGLRLVKDGRLGFAYTSDVDRLEDAGGKALSLSRLAPRTGYVLPSGGRPYSEVTGTFDPALVALEPSEVVRMAGELVDAAKGLHQDITVSGAGVGVGMGAVAIVNSEGIAIASKGTSISASAYVVLKASTVSTGFEFTSSRVLDIDATGVGEAAARMAVDAQGARPLEEGGELTVVFRPTAIAELLENTLVPSLIGDAAQRGESAFTGRAGERVASRDLKVTDDPTLAHGLNSGRSDDEGVPTRSNTMIDGGILEGFLYDTFTANEYDVESTGSAMRGGGGPGWKSQPDAGVTNLVVEAPSKGSLEDLVAEVDRGILIHDVMGAHTANRSTLDFSVNSTMPFEIRSGELQGVRHPVMLGGNVGRLMEMLLGAGGDPRQCPGSMGPSNIVVPWMAAEGIRVTP
jgi:PmbA protein